MKRLAVIWVTGLFFLLFILGRCWTQPVSQERWYQLRIGGHAVGYVMEQVQPEAGAGPVQTTQVMSMKLNRLGQSVALSSRAVCRESADGHLQELISEVRFSEQPVTTFVQVSGQEIWLSSTTMPATVTSAERRIAFSGELSGLEGIRQLAQDALDRPGDSVMYQTFAPDLGIIVKGMRRFIAWEEKTILGKTQKWKKVLETLQGMPVNRQLWLDEQGRPVASAEPFPFGEMTLELAERMEALAAAEGGDLPSEMYGQTLARSDVRLPQARLLESVTLRLRHRRPELGFPELNGEYQRVIEQGPDFVVLRIDRPDPVPYRPVGGEPPMEEYLRSNTYLNADDTLIRKTAVSVVGNEKDDGKKALMIRDWVHENVVFDLGITWASSTEIIRSRKGTCVSFATLVATLARAVGIPSRVLMGYVYVNGIWGGHAWAELFIDGAWRPFDAAIVSPGIADAGRFFFSVNSLSEGPAGSVIGGQQLFGNIDIDVLSYTLGRNDFRPKRPAYSVNKNQFVHHDLGISLQKPEGGTFHRLDEVWPSDVLLEIQIPEQAIIRLHQRYRDQPWLSEAEQIRGFVPEGALPEAQPWKRKDVKLYTYRSADVSGALLATGNDVFILEATGPEAGRALEQLLSTLTL